MRQRFGQNFLIDKNIAEKIIDSAGIQNNDTIIEIGPGRGILTNIIVPKVQQLVAIELDKKLADNLKEKFRNYKNIQIVNSDFWDYDIPNDLSNIKFIANLPYYIATAIIEKVLTSKNWSQAIFMVQKEVAQRITAKPDTKEYGYFSLLCQYYSDPNIIMKVGPGCFKPKPKVESCVIRFVNKCSKDPGKKVFKLIKLAFGQRRKTIINAISNGLGCPKDVVEHAIKALKIKPNSRPENLGFQQFFSLTLALEKYIIL